MLLPAQTRIKKTETCSATPAWVPSCITHVLIKHHSPLTNPFGPEPSRPEPSLNSDSVSRQTVITLKTEKVSPPPPPTSNFHSENGEKMTNLSLSHVESVVILAFQPGEKSYSSEDVPGCAQYIDIQAAIEFNMSLLNISPRESLPSL